MALTRIKERRPKSELDDPKERRKDFEEILKMETSDSQALAFKSKNINAWKVAFAKVRGDKKFVIKREKTDKTQFKIWRYE